MHLVYNFQYFTQIVPNLFYIFNGLEGIFYSNIGVKLFIIPKFYITIFLIFIFILEIYNQQIHILSIIPNIIMRKQRTFKYEFSTFFKC